MTTGFDATALAAELGITREVFPEFFQPSYFIHCKEGTNNVTRLERTGFVCNLPDPESASCLLPLSWSQQQVCAFTRTTAGAITLSNKATPSTTSTKTTPAAGG